MTPDVTTLTATGALVTGLAYGAGPCAASCLPYLGPVFFAGGYHGGAAWRAIAVFSMGRLTGYAAVGAISGAAGAALPEVLTAPLGKAVLGFAMCVAGMWLLMRAGRKSGGDTACAGGCENAADRAPAGLFAAGFGMTLNPCAPLAAVNMAAVMTASPLEGGALGLSFGAGALLTPALLFGGIVAAVGDHARRNLGALTPYLSRMAAAMMVAIGITTLSGVYQP